MYKDIALDSIITWQEALGLLSRLCGFEADISYNDRLIGGFRLPALEVRLDQPARLTPPDVRGNVHVWRNGAVVLGETQEQLQGEACRLPQTGAAAAVYAAFLTLAQLLERISAQLSRDTFQWAWYSIPVPTFCDDAALTAQRTAAAFEKGAVCSLWLRCESDEPIRAMLSGLSGCGQVRIHNLTTANTWIAGAEDEEGLARAFGLR